MRKLYLTNLNYSEIEDIKNSFFLGDWIKDNYLFEKKLNLQPNNIFSFD